MNTGHNNSNITHESSVAVGNFALERGFGAGLDLAPALRRRRSSSTGRNLKFFVGELFGLFFILLSSAYIFTVPVAWTRPGALKAFLNRMVKRTIDIIGAVVGLILTLPFWLILPILIRLDSPGPVFYTQLRVGVNRRKSNRRYHRKAETGERRTRDRRREDILGKPFMVIKFRTMVDNAERDSGPVWARKADPRITRLGQLMRNTRLDEIPQFINILRGDMALVGPRPERPTFVRDLCGKVNDYAGRLQVKPGLTGLAQVENGYDSSVSSVVEKVRFDLQYIRNWSLFADVKIILKTVLVVVTGKGAC